jgi:hypothetical protein
VTSDARRSRTGRLGRAAMGERLGGFIYGTILVLAVLVAAAKAYPDSPGRMAIVVLATSAVFWLAHVYAHALGHGVAHEQHLSRAELGFIARREAAVIEAAVPPVAALLLGVLGVLSTNVAVWLAFGLGLTVLAAQGVQVARIERLSWLPAMGLVAANLALGVLLIALKLLVNH